MIRTDTDIMQDYSDLLDEITGTDIECILTDSIVIELHNQSRRFECIGEAWAYVFGLIDAGDAL